MFSINNNKFNNKSTHLLSIKTTSSPWLELKNVTHNIEFSTQYAQVCLQHSQAKKWVLIINPSDSSLEQLAKTHDVDVSKILCVNLKNKSSDINKSTFIDLDIEQIKNVLCKGNCSAVILSNATFNNKEISELGDSARQGQTLCVLLQKQSINLTNDNKVVH
jgi:cell division inhibitor SulA